MITVFGLFFLFFTLLMILVFTAIKKARLDEVEFIDGNMPDKSGYYYVLLLIEGKISVVVDFFYAEKYQWQSTRNITCIQKYARITDEMAWRLK